MKLPTEMLLEDPQGVAFYVRFDYDRGEPERWNGLTGVGNPETPASVEITEVNFGSGWQTPDKIPQLDIERCEQEVMDKLAEFEAEYWEGIEAAERADAHILWGHDEKA